MKRLPAPASTMPMMGFTVALANLSGCGGDHAGPPAAPAASAAPSTSISTKAVVTDMPKVVVQPRLHYSDGSKRDQGTAFFASFEARVYAVTSSHFVDRSPKPALRSVELLTVTGKPLLEVDETWDSLGNGGIDGEIADLRDDELFLPVTRAPAGYQVVKFDPRRPCPWVNVCGCPTSGELPSATPRSRAR